MSPYIDLQFSASTGCMYPIVEHRMQGVQRELDVAGQLISANENQRAVNVCF